MVETAMVTGASSGIGAAFAEALAGRGTDLVLVARTEDALRALADRLTTRSGVSVEVCAADLADPAGLALIEARLAERARPIDLLINNAGSGFLGDFVELPVNSEEAVIRLNVLALVRLCHAAAGSMVARGHGGIINVSSIDAHFPIPLMSTYAASKAFVSSFSQALREELQNSGVVVTVVEPGVTRTNFFEGAALDESWLPDLLIRPPAEAAEVALRAHDKRRARVVPSWLYRTAVAVTDITPNILNRKVAHALMGRSRRR